MIEVLIEGFAEGLAGNPPDLFVARAGLDLAMDFFADLAGSRDFLTRFAGGRFDFAGNLRVIFAMMGVY